MKSYYSNYLQCACVRDTRACTTGKRLSPGLLFFELHPNLSFITSLSSPSHHPQYKSNDALADACLTRQVARCTPLFIRAGLGSCCRRQLNKAHLAAAAGVSGPTQFKDATTVPLSQQHFRPRYRSGPLTYGYTLRCLLLPEDDASFGTIAASNRVCAPTQSQTPNRRVMTPRTFNHCKTTIKTLETSPQRTAATEYSSKKERQRRAEATSPFTPLQHWTPHPSSRAFPRYQIFLPSLMIITAPVHHGKLDFVHRIYTAAAFGLQQARSATAIVI